MRRTLTKQGCYTDEEITERTAAWMALFDQWDAIQMDTDGQVRGTG